MNSREDVLAEINALKILVWKLWKDEYGNITEKDWNDLKNDVIKKMKGEQSELYEYNKQKNRNIR